MSSGFDPEQVADLIAASEAELSWTQLCEMEGPLTERINNDLLFSSVLVNGILSSI
jgi:hypothetical protein